MVAIESYEDFVNVHGLLLTAAGVPESLYKQLFQKLSTETFDGGNFFQIEPCEDGRQRRLVLTADSMPKDSNVFLIDHAWTFRLADAPKQLAEVPGLVERMGSLMCVDIDLQEDPEDTADDLNDNHANATVEEILESEICGVKEMGKDKLKWLELEELNIDDDMILTLDLPDRCPGKAHGRCNSSGSPKIRDLQFTFYQ